MTCWGAKLGSTCRKWRRTDGGRHLSNHEIYRRAGWADRSNFCDFAEAVSKWLYLEATYLWSFNSAAFEVGFYGQLPVSSPATAHIHEDDKAYQKMFEHNCWSLCSTGASMIFTNRSCRHLGIIWRAAWHRDALHSQTGKSIDWISSRCWHSTISDRSFLHSHDHWRFNVFDTFKPFNWPTTLTLLLQLSCW